MVSAGLRCGHGDLRDRVQPERQFARACAGFSRARRSADFGIRDDRAARGRLETACRQNPRARICELAEGRQEWVFFARLRLLPATAIYGAPVGPRGGRYGGIGNSVEEDGRARHIRIKKAMLGGLTETASGAVQKWRFKPARGPDGKAAAVREMVTVSFHFY